jgi:hypothetical protein
MQTSRKPIHLYFAAIGKQLNIDKQIRFILKNNRVFLGWVRKLKYVSRKKILDPYLLRQNVVDCRKNDKIVFKKNEA